MRILGVDSRDDGGVDDEAVGLRLLRLVGDGVASGLNDGLDGAALIPRHSGVEVSESLTCADTKRAIAGIMHTYTCTVSNSVL